MTQSECKFWTVIYEENMICVCYEGWIHRHERSEWVLFTYVYLCNGGISKTLTRALTRVINTPLRGPLGRQESSDIQTGVQNTCVTNVWNKTQSNRVRPRLQLNISLQSPSEGLSTPLLRWDWVNTTMLQSNCFNLHIFDRND